MPGGYPIAPEDHPNNIKHRREIARTARSAMLGHVNCVVDLSLDVSPATSTTLTNAEIHPGSGFFIHPLDVTAVTDYHAGNISILGSNVGDGTATVSHSANASARSIRVAIFG